MVTRHQILFGRGVKDNAEHTPSGGTVGERIIKEADLASYEKNERPVPNTESNVHKSTAGTGFEMAYPYHLRSNEVPIQITLWVYMSQAVNKEIELSLGHGSSIGAPNISLLTTGTAAGWQSLTLTGLKPEDMLAEEAGGESGITCLASWKKANLGTVYAAYADLELGITNTVPTPSLAQINAVNASMLR
jgi:hypothetical protein